MNRVLNVLLTHQPVVQMERMLAWWRDCCPPENVLVVFNGAAETLARLDHPNKTRVSDPRLQTVLHCRERQSYTGVWQAVSRWLEGRDYTHVHFAEYDQVPLVANLNERQAAYLEQEHADVLAFQLQRVDGTNQPVYLNHCALPGFFAHWESLSVRPDRRTVLSMFGSGSFWTRAAFDATAALAEPFPIYLELYLPTTAHHLGYRLRDWGAQNRHIVSLGNFVDRIEVSPPGRSLDAASGEDLVERSDRWKVKRHIVASGSRRAGRRNQRSTSQ